MLLQNELLQKLIEEAALEDPGTPSEPTPAPRNLPPNPAPQPPRGGSLADYAQMAVGLDSTQSPRYNQLNAMRNIQEGLGNVRAVTPGELQLGLQRAPFEATDIRAAMGREQDMIPEEERKALNGFLGREVIPKGMGYKRLEKFFPHMARATDMNDPLSLMRAQATMMNAQTNAGRLGLQEQLGPAHLGLRERSLDQKDTSLGLAQGNQDISRTRLGQIPESGITSLRNYASGIDALQKVRKSFEQLYGDTGPIEGRIKKAMLSLGLGTDDPTFAKLNANTIDALAQYIRSISGAQVHVSEFDRLRALAPSIAQTPEQFEALLENMEAVMEDRLGKELEIHKANKRNITGMKEAVMGAGLPMGTPTPATAPDTGGSVKLRSPSGAVVEKPAAVADKLLKNPGWSRAE